MNRTTTAVVITWIALALLAGTSWAGVATAPNLQQTNALNIDIWLSKTDSTQPLRRLDPGISEVQAVIQSDLRETDPNRFRVELVDANGVVVFQSNQLTLPTGPHTEMVQVSGNDVFSAYTANASTWTTLLVNAVAEALASAKADNPSAGRVGDRINDALAGEANLSGGVERLRAFDLGADGDADTAFQAAQAALTDVNGRLSEARGLLEGSPIDWSAVETKLQAADTAVNEAANQIQSGLDALTDQTRTFPPTSVAGRCNQNAVQLRVSGSETVSGSFWWTVGTPGDPTRLTNPQEPASVGSLLARTARIYSTEVTVASAQHDTTVDALVLDALCIPVPGVTITFGTLSGSIVTLQETEVTTDADGMASVTVNATSELGEDGTATVSATVDSATAATDLTVVGPPHRLSLRLGGAEVVRVPNYGMESTVQISAIVKDINQNDVADGTPVRFTITPADHSFPDSGQVTTANGQASATLVLGPSTGIYQIEAISGGVSDVQAIRVVGHPATIEIEANPSMIPVNTPVIDRRSSSVTVRVKDDEGRPAPDGTVVEFEISQEDAAFVYFPTLSQVGPGQYTTSIVDGEVTATLIGNPTLYRRIEIQVTARYWVGNEVRGSALGSFTVTLRGGQSVFLPLIRR